jgi:hypothetical protein
VNVLRDALETSELRPFRLTLDKVGRFSARDYETVYLGTSNPNESHSLWKVVVDAMGGSKNDRPYTPHMTLGQVFRNADSIAFLTDKGKKLLRHGMSWLVDSVAVLRKREDQGGFMDLYAQIPIGNAILPPRTLKIAGTPTFCLDGTTWVATSPPSYQQCCFTLATYNVHYSSVVPLESRISAIRDAILESKADIICLQEVTDELLSSILRDSSIRDRFRFCSRGENAVMESERNSVLLACEGFGFEWVPVKLGRKHQMAVVAKLHTPHGLVVIVAFTSNLRWERNFSI